MAVYSVFTKNITTSYKTTLCSKSTLFFISVTFLSFLLPLLIAYRSQGFWVKQLSYREQPVIRFKNEYFIHIESQNEGKPIICTSYNQQSEALEEFNKCIVLKFNEADNNEDGKSDQLHVQARVSTRENFPVHSLLIVLVFDYTLQIQCRLRMESLAVIQLTSPFEPTMKLSTFGDLQLVQKSLLHCRGRDNSHNTSSFDEEGLNIDRLIRDHSIRNVSTRLDNKYSLWTRGRSENALFELDVLINYPETLVHYRPGFWPVMKWAWVQYFSILVLFLGFARWVKGYVFLNHLLPTVPFSPWKKSI